MSRRQRRTCVAAVVLAMVGATAPRVARAEAPQGYEALLSNAEVMAPLFSSAYSLEQMQSGYRFPEMERRPNELLGQYRQRFHWVAGPDPAGVGETQTRRLELDGGGLMVTTNHGNQYAQTETYPLSCGGFIGACRVSFESRNPSNGRQSLFNAPRPDYDFGFFYLSPQGKPQAIGYEGALMLVTKDLALGALGQVAESAVVGASRVAEHFGARRGGSLESKALHVASLLHDQEYRGDGRWSQELVLTWNAMVKRIDHGVQPPEHIQVGPYNGQTVSTVTPGPGRNLWVRRQWQPSGPNNFYRLQSTELFHGDKQLTLGTNLNAPILNSYLRR